MRPSAWTIDAQGFQTLRITCGLSLVEAARLLHVTPRTVRRWESGRTRVPYSAFRLLRIARNGELPGRAWEGFRVAGDTLFSPEGKPFKAHELAYLSLTFAMARAWQRDYRVRCQLQRVFCAPAGVPAQAGETVGAQVHRALRASNT